MNVGVIVEGHGETTSVPILLRRIAAQVRPDVIVHVPPPLRLSRGKITTPTELARAVDLMARKVGPDGPVLIFIDADDDCPADLGPRLLAVARAARADRPIGVIVAQREFEAWYLASAISLRGVRGLPGDLTPPASDQIRNAKGWLDQRMPTGYAPTVDQPRLAAMFSLEEARANRSFARCEALWLKLVENAVPLATEGS